MDKFGQSVRLFKFYFIFFNGGLMFWGSSFIWVHVGVQVFIYIYIVQLYMAICLHIIINRGQLVYMYDANVLFMCSIG